MADLDPTPSNVYLVAGGIETMIAAEAIAAGAPVYRNNETGKAFLADADAAGKDAVLGIALNSAAVNQPVTIAKTGSEIVMGEGPSGQPAQGTVFVLSRNAGKICPVGDAATGDKVTIIGVGSGSFKIKLSIYRSGVAVP